MKPYVGIYHNLFKQRETFTVSIKNGLDHNSLFDKFLTSKLYYLVEVKERSKSSFFFNSGTI